MHGVGAFERSLSESELVERVTLREGCRIVTIDKSSPGNQRMLAGVFHDPAPRTSDDKVAGGSTHDHVWATVSSPLPEPPPHLLCTYYLTFTLMINRPRS